jgi:hypothetical protein
MSARRQRRVSTPPASTPRMARTTDGACCSARDHRPRAPAAAQPPHHRGRGRSADAALPERAGADNEPPRRWRCCNAPYAFTRHHSDTVTALDQEQSPGEREPTRLPLVEAVAQTPGEPPGSLLRVGSENTHPVCRAHVVHRAVVAHGCADMPFRYRAAAFPRRLYATASVLSDSSVRADRDACLSTRLSHKPPARPLDRF